MMMVVRDPHRTSRMFWRELGPALVKLLGRKLVIPPSRYGHAGCPTLSVRNSAKCKGRIESFIGGGKPILVG